jgi:hypothetical protein
MMLPLMASIGFATQWTSNVMMESGFRYSVTLLQEDSTHFLPRWPSNALLSEHADTLKEPGAIYALPLASGKSCRSFCISVFEKSNGLSNAYQQIIAPIDAAAATATCLWDLSFGEGNGVRRDEISVSAGGLEMAANAGCIDDEVHVTGFRVMPALKEVKQGHELRNSLTSALEIPDSSIEFCALTAADLNARQGGDRTLLIELRKEDALSSPEVQCKIDTWLMGKAAEAPSEGRITKFLDPHPQVRSIVVTSSTMNQPEPSVDAMVSRVVSAIGVQGAKVPPNLAHECLAPHWAARFGIIQEGIDEKNLIKKRSWINVKLRDSPIVDFKPFFKSPMLSEYRCSFFPRPNGMAIAIKSRVIRVQRPLM